MPNPSPTPEDQRKDYRTPEAKKWLDDFIPPETCGNIDDVQNSLEHLRDANSQLRHVAHLLRHRLDFTRIRLAEIGRLAKNGAAPAVLLAEIALCAEEGLSHALKDPADV